MTSKRSSTTSITPFLNSPNRQFADFTTVRSLKSIPERGRIGRRPGTREIIFYPLPYIVSYRLTDQAVEVLRIHHGAQDRTEQ